jgi:hypothetical protein
MSLLLLQVPRSTFYTASMSGVVGSQLGQFGHKPEVLGELLAGEGVNFAVLRYELQSHVV